MDIYKLLNRDTNLFKVFFILIESFQRYFVFFVCRNVVLLKHKKQLRDNTKF